MKRVAIGAAGAAMCILASATAAQLAVQAPGGFVPRTALSYGGSGEAAVAVDDAHPLPVQPRGRAVTYVDRSGTIAAANATQTIATANAQRGGMIIQNLSTGDLWVGVGAAATAGQPSLRIGAGQLLEFPSSGVPCGAIALLGGTAGQAFVAKEW